jgi:hypothetical protein
MKTTDSIDLCFSFDTTGSMYPCLTQVRRYVKDTVQKLFSRIPNLRVGVITHGDYCDGQKAITQLDIGTNQKEICKFIQEAPATHGGDSPECYEKVLSNARALAWSAGKSKALVLIGDDIPHPVGYTMHNGKYTYDFSYPSNERNKLDWRNEAKLLVEAGVSIYAVQALGFGHATHFYDELAQIGGTPKLNLAQFGQVATLLEAICYRQGGNFNEYEKYLYAEAKHRIDPSLLTNLDALSGRKSVSRRKTVADAVHPSRFQILNVNSDCSIKNFVQENGLPFKKGRGFYEFTKPVKVQSYKEVIIQDKESGEMFSGDRARAILGIPVGVAAKVKPTDLEKYKGFIQSTSVNRKLLEGTSFLYEVSDERY